MSNKAKLKSLIETFNAELSSMAKTYEKQLEIHRSIHYYDGMSFPNRYLVSFYLDEETLKPFYMISEQSKLKNMAKIGLYNSIFYSENFAEFEAKFRELLEDNSINRSDESDQTDEFFKFGLSCEIQKLSDLSEDTFFVHSGDLYYVSVHLSDNTVKAVKMYLDLYFFEADNGYQIFSGDTQVLVLKSI